jgi:hypothetical protein
MPGDEPAYLRICPPLCVHVTIQVLVEYRGLAHCRPRPRLVVERYPTESRQLL